MQREKTISLLPLDQIKLGDNVRSRYDSASIEELAESIRANGLIQPVTVQKQGETEYLLIVGHRRFAAYKLLASRDLEQYQVIPCLVAQLVDADEIAELQLVENIQRENLSAFEIRQTLLHFKARGYTQKQIAEKLGKTTGYIKNLFSAVNSIGENAELEALVAEYEMITLADIHEVKSLDKRLQIKLLKERATGAIRSLKELREKVKGAREKAEESSARRSESKKHIDSYAKVFRLNGEELSFLPARIDLASLSIEKKAELKELLSAVITKLE